MAEFYVPASRYFWISGPVLVTQHLRACLEATPTLRDLEFSGFNFVADPVA